MVCNGGGDKIQYITNAFVASICTACSCSYANVGIEPVGFLR